MQAPKPEAQASASALIDRRIAELADWRGAALRRMRELIHQAEPRVVEAWKWRGTPVWSHGGIECGRQGRQGLVQNSTRQRIVPGTCASFSSASADDCASRSITT